MKKRLYKNNEKRSGEEKEVLIYVEYRFKCVDYVRVCVHLFVTSISLSNKRSEKIYKCKQSISQGMVIIGLVDGRFEGEIKKGFKEFDEFSVRFG